MCQCARRFLPPAISSSLNLRQGDNGIMISRICRAFRDRSQSFCCHAQSRKIILSIRQNTPSPVTRNEVPKNIPIRPASSRYLPLLRTASPNYSDSRCHLSCHFLLQHPSSPTPPMPLTLLQKPPDSSCHATVTSPRPSTIWQPVSDMI